MAEPGVRWRNIIIALTGCLAFALLHLLFVLAWRGFFTATPWPGYEESTRSGLVEPWFVNTPRSLWLTRGTFFVIALVTVLAIRDRIATATLSLWSGAAVAVAATWLTTRGRMAVWGWLGSVLYPFRVLLPIVLGTVAAIVLRTLLRRRTAA